MILEQSLLVLPLLIGAYLSISLMKLPDLSIESAFLFGATIGGLTASTGLSLPAAILGGACVGLTAGFLNQVFKIPYLLSAIITNGLFHGTTLHVMGSPFLSIGEYSLTYENEIFFVVNACLLILVGLGLKTELGISLAIFGNNPNFFRHYGISSRYVVICGVGVAGGCAGLSGYLFAQSNGFVDLMMGYGVVLLSITGLILGKMLIRTAKPTIFVPLVGVVIYFVIQQFLLKVGFNLKYFNTVQALFVLGALYLSGVKQKQLADHLGI